MRFIIDGYNLIFSRRRPGRPLRPINVEAARTAMLGLLGRYKAMTGHSLVVFFDGAPDGSGFLRRNRIYGVDVMFSYPGVTADEEIAAHLEGYAAAPACTSSRRTIRSEIRQAPRRDRHGLSNLPLAGPPGLGPHTRGRRDRRAEGEVRRAVICGCAVLAEGLQRSAA